jgi:hypothetical protein
MVGTYGLTHIHLTVADLDRSLRFYQGVFGAEERFRAGADLVFLRTPGSRDLIALHGNPADPGAVGNSAGWPTSGSNCSGPPTWTRRSAWWRPPAGLSGMHPTTMCPTHTSPIPTATSSNCWAVTP